MRPIPQEDTAGCAIACTASVLNLSYVSASKLFDLRNVSSKGYYLKDIISALKEGGLRYVGSKVNTKNKKYLATQGTIVFIKRSKKYPLGHYLLKTERGWMNSWINYPKINPAKAGFQGKLPGKAQWIVYNSVL